MKAANEAIMIVKIFCFSERIVYGGSGCSFASGVTTSPLAFFSALSCPSVEGVLVIGIALASF